MRVKTIAFLFFLLAFAQLKSQQEYTLHFSRALLQSSFTNPAIKQEYKIAFAFPSVAFNYGNNAFSYNDLVQDHPVYDSTFLDVDGVIDKMSDNNVLQMQTVLDVFGMYFTFGDWYTSVFLSEKADFRLTYPKELIDVMWNGNAKYIGQTIDIGPGVNLNYYKELRIGLGRKINKFDVGVAARILFGMANITSVRNTLNLTTGEENYAATLSSDYEIKTSGTDDPLQYLLRPPSRNLNSGFAMDLGVVYHLNDKWEFSQSILGIGGINWKNDVVTYQSQGSFTFSGVDISEFIDEEQVQFENLADSIEELYFTETQGGEYWSPIPTESYTGVLFTPDDKTSIGAIVHISYFSGVHFGSSIYVGRQLLEVFNLGLSYSIKNRRYDNVGLNLSIGPKGFKIFVITDNLLTFARNTAGKNSTWRYGVNLNIGNARFGMDKKRRKDKSVPEVPQIEGGGSSTNQ